MNLHLLSGPRRSVILVSPKRPSNVYLAFPKLNYQVEVAAPTPVQALSVARSGRVWPVGW